MLTEKIKFSIIVPVYNVQNYINTCLNSIVSQSYQNYEVIIICDKCSDNSEKIVDKYVKKYSNFKKIYKEGTGLSIARNIGVSSANGDYLLFLDGDDYLEKDCLNQLYLCIKDDNIDLIRFQVQSIDNGKIIKYSEKGFEKTNGTDSFNYIINYHYIENAWTYCYNINFYKQNNFKFMEHCLAEDYGLIPLIIAKAKTIKSIPYIGYNYVIRNNSLMNNDNYQLRIKKADDMLKQSIYLKQELEKINDNKTFLIFINNSLIYYITTLKYIDYIHYHKILIKNNYFDHLLATSFKKKIKKFLIKYFTYIYYKVIVRFYG